MERIVGIYFRGQKFFRENATDGHREVAERIIEKFDLKPGNGEYVDFLINKGAVKIGNRWGNYKMVIFRGGKIDNDSARIIEHYQNECWQIVDMDQEVNW